MKIFFKSKFFYKDRYLHFLSLVIILTISIQTVQSHGTVTYPPSRVYVCYEEIIAADATNPIPSSPPCFDSFITYGSQAFYDWNEVSRMDADNMHMELIPDGNLASAGRPDKYGGLDQLRDDWVATPVSVGPFTMTWTNTAPHETLYYRVYITPEGWTPDQALTWDILELLVETDPRPASATDNIDFVLPQRSGKHVLFSIWQRSLSAEAFYSTSDVDFGSGVVISVAPEANFTTDSGICGGSEVLFDASSSFDDNGDALTYTWDFGDGTTADGVLVNHVFADGLDSSMVTLTVSDDEFSTGITETINLIIDEDCSELVCSYDAPTENAFPAINASYDTLFVIGERGPNLENITRFVINWDGNNLHQFDFNFNISPFYSSFSSADNTFDQSSPQITIEGTTIEGLDGDYYVTMDEDNFVLASISGGYTIYFSQTDTAPECDDNVSVTTETLRGGTLTSDTITYQFTVGDENEDYVTDVTLGDNIGDEFQWLITNQAGNIISLPDNVEDFNFDTVDLEEGEEERAFIYNISYNGSISGLVVGSSTITLDGDYELSNAIEIYLTTDEEVIIEEPVIITTCTFDTPRETSMPTMNYRSYNTDDSQGTGSITVIGENGPDLSPYRKLDIAYSNGELTTLFFQTWVTFVQVNLVPNTVHTFDQVNPELTLSNTGIDNLDGSYYVTVVENEEFGSDFADFVMVSQTGDFSIYFTYSNEAPDCDETLSVETNEIDNTLILQQNYPNPFSETSTIEYTLRTESSVSLKIFNINGQLVKELDNGMQSIGDHKLTFDLNNVKSGVYIYVLETSNGIQTKSMVKSK